MTVYCEAPHTWAHVNISGVLSMKGNRSASCWFAVQKNTINLIATFIGGQKRTIVWVSAVRVGECARSGTSSGTAYGGRVELA